MRSTLPALAERVLTVVACSLANELNQEKARHSATLSGIDKLRRGVDDVHATGAAPLSTFGGASDAIAGPSTST